MTRRLRYPVRIKQNTKAALLNLSYNSSSLEKEKAKTKDSEVLQNSSKLQNKKKKNNFSVLQSRDLRSSERLWSPSITVQTRAKCFSYVRSIWRSSLKHTYITFRIYIENSSDETLWSILITETRKGPNWTLCSQVRGNFHFPLCSAGLDNHKE